MSYQSFLNQSPSTGSAGGAGAPYLGVSGTPNSRGYSSPGGYPEGYLNVGLGGYPNPGNVAYSQRYYYRPGYGPNASDKSRLVALLLARLFGVIGVHRLYVGKIGNGAAMIFTPGGLEIWTLVDIIMIATGSFTGIDGRPVAV